MMMRLWFCTRSLCFALTLMLSVQMGAYADALLQPTLPNTDGAGLLAAPNAGAVEQVKSLMQAAFSSCDQQCATPFGQVLGTADGAEGKSNCQSTCVHLEYTFLNTKTGEVVALKKDPKQQDLFYVGLTYQCVEFARKWWMKNLDSTFGSVDRAHEIIYLTEGTNIRTGKTFPLGRSINGTAIRPPKRGDLLIYYPDPSRPEWRSGHVAVVVATDLEKGMVSVAEENYDNLPWKDPQAFSRQIRLFRIGDYYRLVDISVDAVINEIGGEISGWVYPVLE